MFSKKSRGKDFGAILMGFAVLMVGMDLMSGAVSGLKGDPSFTKLLTMFSNPLLGVLAGTVLTAIVQSSSASVGILQALSSTGAISFAAAIPIIMGQNIGTCVTAMISSAGANKNGKRAALVHLYFNVIGVAVWMGLYYLLGWILSATGRFDLLGLAEGTPINMWGIAAVHTVFKLLSVILLFPASGLLEKLAAATIRGDDKRGDEYTAMLDDRLLDTPSVAIERSRTVAGQMAAISGRYLRKSIDLFDAYDEKTAEKIRLAEGRVDTYEDALGSYLVKLSAVDMDAADSHEVTKLLHLIGDLERISDHSVNLLESAEEMRDKELTFSEEAKAELRVLYDAVCEIVTITEQALASTDLTLAARVEPLEQVIDGLRDSIKSRHIRRLTQSECTVEHGFVLSDILTNLERVADHCSNVAGCLLEMAQKDTRGLHDYLQRVKAGGLEFHRLYGEYREKYILPDGDQG
jgi:phosphate:Na+ symporter